jgi:hypothetical protein
MQKAICSACSNEIEIEVISSQYSIQCPVCSEWIKLSDHTNQTVDSNQTTNSSNDVRSSLVGKIFSGLKSSGFFKGWVRFLVSGIIIAILAVGMNTVSALIKQKNAEIQRQQIVIAELKQELSSLKGGGANASEIKSDEILVSDLKTQVQLYQSKKPDIVEYTGEVKNNTKNKIVNCVLVIGFYQYASDIKLSEENVEIGTLSAGEIARFKNQIKLIDTMLANGGSGPDSDSGRARVIGFKYGPKSDQRELSVAGMIRSDDSRRF